MSLLSSPNIAYLLVVVGITLLFLGQINPKTWVLIVGMILSLIAVGLGFLYLRLNPWALLVVALSPLLFSTAVRQERPQNPLFIISIFMFTLGTYFLFVDQANQPTVRLQVVFVSVLSAAIIWIASQRLRNVEGARLADDPGSVIGRIGETITDIERFSAGSVMIDGEIWQARSKEPIPAGNTVRVLRQDGFWLTVKQVGNLSKSSK